MKERAMEILKAFGVGAVNGAVTGIITRKYDEYVSYLPKPVRYTVDGIVMVSTLWVGHKMAMHLLNKTDILD